ncbi:MAG TPA: hypothetical protein VJG32_05720 [Anaerolineae bacterium]|nr:hypothetical protein [Anaerolineae bacterium]
MNRQVGRVGLAAVLALSAIIVLMSALGETRRAAGSPAYVSYGSGDFFFPPYPADSDRLGVGGSIALYSATLRAGWYTDWSANPDPPHPGGMEYARLIAFSVNTNGCGVDKIPATERGQVTASLTGTALIDNLRANPGALWLIGNEPDSIYNCAPIMPELYAELYHEFYTFIQTHDPTARVAIAGIVQPSPLRLEYLDKVLNRYVALYGESLPTALWNIHLYALPEHAGRAGAGVPPGASSDTGWTTTWAQTVDVDLIVQNLRAMRQWLAEHGERDKPLIITEFGQLIPDDGSYTLDGLTFTPEVSRDYLRGSITAFLNAADPEVGYPADGNRLVQLWAWYSLYDPQYGGDLLNPAGSFTPAGVAFAELAAAHFIPAADLYPVPLITPSIPAGHAGLISVALTVQVDNRGNAPIAAVPVQFAQYDFATGALLASRALTLAQVLDRYAGAQPQLGQAWVLEPGALYTVAFEIDPGQTISQARRTAQALSYPIGWAADLALVSLSSDLPPTFVWSDPTTATLTATIRNVGNFTAATGLVQFELIAAEGALLLTSSVSLPPLAPDAAAAIAQAIALPAPGDYRLRAEARYPGVEWTDQNNAAALGILAARMQLHLPLALRNSP